MWPKCACVSHISDISETLMEDNCAPMHLVTSTRPTSSPCNPNETGILESFVSSLASVQHFSLQPN